MLFQAVAPLIIMATLGNVSSRLIKCAGTLQVTLAAFRLPPFGVPWPLFGLRTVFPDSIAVGEGRQLQRVGSMLIIVLRRPSFSFNLAFALSSDELKSFDCFHVLIRLSLNVDSDRLTLGNAKNEGPDAGADIAGAVTRPVAFSARDAVPNITGIY